MRPQSATPRCSSRCASRCASTAGARTRRSGAALWLDGPNIAAAGIALSAVNPRGVRSTRAEEALAGRPPSEEAFAAAAALAAEDCDPIGDQRGPADYKRHLARELTHRALRRAAQRALAS